MSTWRGVQCYVHLNSQLPPHAEHVGPKCYSWRRKRDAVLFQGQLLKVIHKLSRKAVPALPSIELEAVSLSVRLPIAVLYDSNAIPNFPSQTDR